MNDDVVRELMLNELQILAEISHPSIVKIYELLEDSSNYFIVSELMEYGELSDIRDKIQSSSKLTENEIQMIA